VTSACFCFSYLLSFVFTLLNEFTYVQESVGSYSLDNCTVIADGLRRLLKRCDTITVFDTNHFLPSAGLSRVNLSARIDLEEKKNGTIINDNRIG